MLIIVDKRILAEAKKYLQCMGELLEIESKGIVYDAVSGHPDVIMCIIDHKIIIAPNAPSYIIEKLKATSLELVFGYNPLSFDYPETAFYNVVVTEKHLIHNTNITDKVILENIGNREIINVKQGYTRCNLIPLNSDNFITSDKGIEKELRQHNLNVLYVDPKEIFLTNFPHGFFGGCCGVLDKQLFINGDFKKDSSSINAFVNAVGYSINNIHKNQLHDVGGIFFLI